MRNLKNLTPFSGERAKNDFFAALQEIFLGLLPYFPYDSKLEYLWQNAGGEWNFSKKLFMLSLKKTFSESWLINKASKVYDIFCIKMSEILIFIKFTAEGRKFPRKIPFSFVFSNLSFLFGQVFGVSNIFSCVLAKEQIKASLEWGATGVLALFRHKKNI